MILALCAVVMALPVAAQPDSSTHASVQILLDRDAIVPGQPTTVAVVFEVEQGWHIYSDPPGDSGMPPKVKWTVPAGVEIGALQFPPHEKYDNGAGIDNVFFGNVALLATLTASSEVKLDQEIEIGADVRWLVCKDVCLPGRSKQAVRVKTAAESKANREDEFNQWKSLVQVASTRPVQ
jgi:DsbC/DsbD-like thiol-disulfide interchange protein